MKIKREKQSTMIQTKDRIIFQKQDHRHKDVEVNLLGKKVTMCFKCGFVKIGYYEDVAIYFLMNERPMLESEKRD